MTKKVDYAKQTQGRVSQIVEERDEARSKLMALLLILSDDEVHGVHLNDPYDEEGWKWICEYAGKCRDAHMRECEERARNLEEQWQRERRESE